MTASRNLTAFMYDSIKHQTSSTKHHHHHHHHPPHHHHKHNAIINHDTWVCHVSIHQIPSEQRASQPPTAAGIWSAPMTRPSWPINTWLLRPGSGEIQVLGVSGSGWLYTIFAANILCSQRLYINMCIDIHRYMSMYVYALYICMTNTCIYIYIYLFISIMNIRCTWLAVNLRMSWL